MTKTLSLFEFFRRKQNSPLGLLQELRHHFSARSAGARLVNEGIPPPHTSFCQLACRLFAPKIFLWDGGTYFMPITKFINAFNFFIIQIPNTTDYGRILHLATP